MRISSAFFYLSLSYFSLYIQKNIIYFKYITNLERNQSPGGGLYYEK